MGKLDDILELLDLQNRAVVLITGIDHLITDAYGGEATQTSPEVLDKALRLFVSLDKLISQEKIISVPNRIINLAGVYLLEECRDKEIFCKLLENKFIECYFDVLSDYAGFYTYCKASDRPDIAESATLFMGGLRKEVDYLSALFDIQTAATSSNPALQYDYDPAFCTTVYDFCVASRVFTGITHAQFCACVASADFSAIFNLADTKVAKLKYVIYILSRRIDNPRWYMDSAHSIDTEPNKCSGASVPMEWKKRALAIK